MISNPHRPKLCGGVRWLCAWCLGNGIEAYWDNLCVHMGVPPFCLGETYDKELTHDVYITHDVYCGTFFLDASVGGECSCNHFGL